jgi:AraC-like DNA-binding protein
MSAENDVYKIGRYYMMQSYLMQYMLSVLRDEQLPGEPGGHVAFESINKNRIVEEIILYFEEHYSEKISLELISENMYVSPFYISKIFKMVTGDTPIRYLINIRLDKAKELLETSPDLNVREIADKVGYDDAYHFSKLFKKRFGVSPTTVKKP